MTALFLSNAMRKRIDKSPRLQRLRWHIEAGVLSSIWQLCGLLSAASASAFGRRCLRWVGPRMPKSRHMRRNIALAFPNLDEPAREALLRDIWGNTGAVLGEFPHFKTLCQKDFERHFETVEITDLDDYRSGRKQGIFLAAHIGNWELSAAAAVRLGVPLTVVYAPSTNPLIDAMFLRRRADLNCKLISRSAGAYPLIRELANGRSLGLVADQRDDGGMPLPFFGLDKLTSLFPARLALRFNCDLIPTRVERLGNARFRVTFHPPIRPDDKVADEKDRAALMMREVNQVFETWIRERPQEWLCNKRNWAKDPAPRTS